MTRKVNSKTPMFICNSSRLSTLSPNTLLCNHAILVGWIPNLSNQLQPDNPQTLTRLALLLATSPQAKDRNASQAMEFARQACDVTSQQDPLALQAYAAAAAENGKFNEAIQWQNRAIQLAPENQKRSMQALLELYLAKKAFRLPTKK